MASMRLTNAHRDEILSRALKHAFGAQVEKLRDAYISLANDVYDDVFSEADRKRIDAMPEGWLPVDGEVYVCFSSSHCRLAFNGRNARIRGQNLCEIGATVYRRFPNKQRGACLEVYSAAHKLSERYETLRDTYTDLQEKNRRGDCQDPCCAEPCHHFEKSLGGLARNRALHDVHSIGQAVPSGDPNGGAERSSGPACGRQGNRLISSPSLRVCFVGRHG